MPVFNLIDEPWIPCVMLSGEAREMSLCDALTSAHEVRELFDSSPLVTAALHRLLLSVAQRNFAPSGLVQWKTLWSAGRFDQVNLNSYFRDWRDRFDLFHAERPFYQQAQFAAKKTTPLKRLGWEFAAGNNATLFDHSWDGDRPEIPPATAARWVVATQTFAPSAGKSETLHTKDSPWTRGAVILMQGDNLFETLALNLLSLLKPDFPSFADDCPAWELKEVWDPAHGLTPAGKLSYLTWQSRSIRLLPINDGVVRECYFAQGRALHQDWRSDPMFAYKRNSERGLLVWQFNPDRAVWRDSHALFKLSPDAPFQIPQALAHIATLAREGVVHRHRLYQLQILGQCLESGQPTIHFWRQERLPVAVEYLDDSSLLDRLGEALRLAEDCARSLEQSLWSLAKLLVATNSDHKEARQPDKKDIKNIIDSFGAAPHYWAQLEAPFKQLLIDLPSDKAERYGELTYGDRELPRWAETLHRTATSAFTLATRSLDNSSRALKAVAKAEPPFRAKLRGILGDYLKQPAANGR